jgi:hypothetical protein
VRREERTTTPLNDARRRELQALRDQVEALEEVNDLLRRAAELEDRRAEREAEHEVEIEPKEEAAAPAIKRKRNVTKNPGVLKTVLVSCLKEHGGEATVDVLHKAAVIAGFGKAPVSAVLRWIATKTSPNTWTLKKEVAS